MTRQHKSDLRDKVKSMFLHAYHSYMTHAFPADELMPLSCKGRFRSHGSGRGDVDDAMGNFSMTLVDTLDTLVLLDEPAEFERAVRLVLETVHFDRDVVVSVFETNIRMLGGLLSAHVLAKEMQKRGRGEMTWYNGELLDLAQDLGYVLLQAFDSGTGVPYPRINLKYGLQDGLLASQKHTCAACAGTMILEFAALSRLSGDPIFETKSREAMDYLWHKRHSDSSLLGHIIDVDSGDWIRRESGIGAGSDSYYEYVLKSYVLLGDDHYLQRFHRHYEALLKYVMKGSRMMDVHMHQPLSTSKPYLDALVAFFPGLQVLYGDIEPAKTFYKTLHKVVQRYNFLPEAFTPEPELRMYWAESYLRPEFIESTYFLYSATKDPLYLSIGEDLVESLETYSRVDCGYAALKDTRSGLHDDRMDSFFLAETLKYLYLLFSEPSELPVDLKDYIFTTEAHLLPLHLARKNVTFFPHQHLETRTASQDPILSCPNIVARKDFMAIWQQIIAEPETVSVPVVPQCVYPPPQRGERSGPLRERSLSVETLDWDNQQHVMILAEMGISLVKREDGTVVIAQELSQARSVLTAAEGVVLMQELVDATRSTLVRMDKLPTARVHLASVLAEFNTSLQASPAQFGTPLKPHDEALMGFLGFAHPDTACSNATTPDEEVPGTVNTTSEEKVGAEIVVTNVTGKIAVVLRGGCMFIEKARNVEAAGAVGMIVVDNKKGTSFKTGSSFAMSSDYANTTIGIPAVFLYDEEARNLVNAFAEFPDLVVTLSS